MPIRDYDELCNIARNCNKLRERIEADNSVPEELLTLAKAVEAMAANLARLRDALNL